MSQILYERPVGRKMVREVEPKGHTSPMLRQSVSVELRARPEPYCLGMSFPEWTDFKATILRARGLSNGNITLSNALLFSTRHWPLCF